MNCSVEIPCCVLALLNTSSRKETVSWMIKSSAASAPLRTSPTAFLLYTWTTSVLRPERRIVKTWLLESAGLSSVRLNPAFLSRVFRKVDLTFFYNMPFFSASKTQLFPNSLLVLFLYYLQFFSEVLSTCRQPIVPLLAVLMSVLGGTTLHFSLAYFWKFPTLTLHHLSRLLQT